MFEPHVYEAVMKDLVRWYRDHDFDGMREEVSNEILDIYLDDGKPLIEETKYQIAINIHFIAKAYDDDQMLNLQDQIINATTKEEAKQALNKISERLKDNKFSGIPLKAPSMAK